MAELRDLYQEVIFDHYRRPRNFHTLEAANRKGEGYNPLCGDRVTLYLRVENDRIVNASFVGAGCAISIASASLMTEHLKGKTVEQARALFQAFQDLVTREGGDPQELGKLAVLAGVREFPARVKCATLGWHTLNAALTGMSSEVSTE